MLLIKHLSNGKWKENCYIISNQARDALVIDPGGDAESILSFIQTEKLHVLAILNTHGHYDHIGAVAPLQAILKTPFYVHSGDLRLIKSANFYRKLFEGDAPITIPEVNYFLDKIDELLVLGDFKVRIFQTPGHTPGGVCLEIDGNLFTGDTLFHLQVGRTDLPGGNPKDLAESLKRLALLPKQTRIFSGHGPDTTLGAELMVNEPFRAAIQ